MGYPKGYRRVSHIMILTDLLAPVGCRMESLCVGLLPMDANRSHQIDIWGVRRPSEHLQLFVFFESLLSSFFVGPTAVLPGVVCYWEGGWSAQIFN